MAELHVQPKKRSSNTWIWVVVALLIIGAAAYFLMQNKQQTENTENATDKTSQYFTAGYSNVVIV